MIYFDLFQKRIGFLIFVFFNFDLSLDSLKTSLPLKSIPSVALKFRPNKLSVSSLAKAFRLGSYPVVGYTKGNVFYIDLKAVLPRQISHLIDSIKQV